MSTARGAIQAPGIVPLAVLPQVAHVRSPNTIRFPEEAAMPKGALHLFLRILLKRILEVALGPASTVSSEHFVYWNAWDPKRCLSPDIFVKLNVAETWYRSWKTWEQGGVPELAVEIVSSEHEEQPKWDEKFARYHELGVHELVRFVPEAEPGKRVCVWERVDDDLIDPAKPSTASGTMFGALVDLGVDPKSENAHELLFFVRKSEHRERWDRPIVNSNRSIVNAGIGGREHALGG